MNDIDNDLSLNVIANYETNYSKITQKVSAA